MAVFGTLLSRIGLAGLLLTGAEPSQETALGLFRHTDHVPKSWLGPGAHETRRDCRGCHDYDAEPSRRAKPAALCTRCHGYQEPDLRGAARVDPASEEEEGKGGAGRFLHHEHRSFDCAKCHRPEKIAEVPAALPMPALGSGACTECHGLTGSAANARTKLEEALDARLEKRGATEVGVFRHDQHIRPRDFLEQDPAVCQRCHFAVKDSDERTLGDKQFSVARCAECHDGIRFEAEPYEKPSRTAATFVHREHLSPKALAASRELASQSCYACHAASESRATFDLGPRFRDGEKLYVYEGCVSCHADKRVAGHGSIDDCRRCHDFDSKGLGGLVEVWKARRARVEVARSEPAAFSFVAQSHAFVTGATDRACEECHKARLPDLPSRLEGKPFRHDTHLSRVSNDGRECRGCHAGMSAASEPAEVVVARPADSGPSGARSLFDLASCQECHRARDLSVNPGSTESRRILRFSHPEHVDRRLRGSGASLDCTTCHVQEDERIELAPGVNECTPCHAHEQPGTTLGHSRNDVAACAFCHERGVPEQREPAPVPRLRLARVEGKRTHPHAPGKDCAACHGPPDPGPPVSRPIALSLAARLRNPHASTRFERAEKHFEANRVADRSTWCIDCHWSHHDSIVKEQGLIMKQPWGNLPEPDWRRKYGELLDAGFPGIPPAPEPR